MRKEEKDADGAVDNLFSQVDDCIGWRVGIEDTEESGELYEGFVESYSHGTGDMSGMIYIKVRMVQDEEDDGGEADYETLPWKSSRIEWLEPPSRQTGNIVIGADSGVDKDGTAAVKSSLSLPQAAGAAAAAAGDKSEGGAI